MPQSTVDDHIRRILRTLFAYGALDHATIPYDNSKIDQAGHKRTAGEVAEQAATLLRNQHGQLPLDASKLKRVALIGSDAATFKNRGGSAGITPFPVTTPLFTTLLVSVVLIVGALTFFPALSLGPIVEHLLMQAGQTF